MKALTDRLAEHSRNACTKSVRRDWYAHDGRLAKEDLVKERYRGIRPAPGYPACPDHTLKGTIWKLLDVEKKADIRITESFAMLPAASVSGFYLAHPDAQYFSLGKIGRDQVGATPPAGRSRWPRPLAPQPGVRPRRRDLRFAAPSARTTA